MNYGLLIKFLQLFFISLLLIFALYSFLISQDYPVRSGSIIFLEKKCNSCHSVNSQAITCSDSSNKSVTDLSIIGDSYNSEILKDYLQKKNKLNNKKHPVAFKETKKDLDILCKWLQNLSSVVY
jgi:capsule polysaccharide export protein KpsE/RkpR